VLDEITSSLDNNNSNKIVSQILEIKDKTVIFSTHKPELLKNFDTIIRIQKGNIFFEKKLK
jgi:ABC-type transport system involved in cytochrome bd biosynthesis fused ATPase/permease subunit